MSRLAKLLLISSLSLVGGVTYAAPAKPAPAPAAKKPAPPKKATVVSADNKKKLEVHLGGFKFGMSKDEVLATLGKQLDEKYDSQLASTEDTAQKDRLRRDKKAELERIKQSYTQFDGKKTGWDVSIVEDEFAHHSNESMIERWENSGGKNQRRFFFYQGKLYKMFISLDVSILPADKKNFDAFKDVMTAQYGAGDVDPGKITWHTDEFDVRAVDKLKTYDALGLAIEDNKVVKDVVADRQAHAPKATNGNAVIDSVVDKDGKDHPDVKQNSNAVDSVIQANGGKK